ncbi:MAG: ABC transporter ATP-binding protein [Candidatus Improbicoccus devescovinae]|nr:MAG: ABC transporter ATP-binding protein [Candidatus Improbicoccus devescovinae]
MNKKIIELNNISVYYYTLKEETQALKNISFDVYNKEFLSIVGPSGCGKSTLFSIISGLITPQVGEILINNRPRENYNFNIGYMLQQDHLLEWRTVRKNVELGLEIQKNLNNDTQNYVLKLLHKYGLGGFLDYYPSQLSGGMRQKLALIRTMALNPEILLFDEPFSALDFQSKIKIADEIKKIVKSENKTAILITHDILEAISLSDRVITLSGQPGQIKNIVNIEIPEASSLERRKHEKFNFYFELIWRGIE